LFAELLLQGAHREGVHDGHDEEGEVEGDDRGGNDERRRLRTTALHVEKKYSVIVI